MKQPEPMPTTRRPGTGFLTGVHLASATRRAVGTVGTVAGGFRVTHPRAYVAAQLITAVQAKTAVGPAGALRSEAVRVVRALGAEMTEAEEDQLCDAALSLKHRVADLPREDQIPVAVAVARELLTDAPDLCMRLDVLLRDAARAQGCTPTDRHEALARETIAHDALSRAVAEDAR